MIFNFGHLLLARYFDPSLPKPHSIRAKYTKEGESIFERNLAPLLPILLEAVINMLGI